MLWMWIGFALAGPQELADRAVQENPGLEAQRAHVASLETAIGGSKQWDDLQFSAELANIPFNDFRLSAHPMSGVQFKLLQRFPTSGRLGAADQAATANWMAAEARMQEAELALRVQVERSYWLIARSRALQELTERHIVFAGDMVESTKAHYQVGHASQADLLRLQVLQGQLEDSLDELQQREAVVLAGLRAILRDPSLSVDAELTEPPSPAGGLAQWQASAETSRPALQALTQDSQAAAARAKVAGRSIAPDLALWVGYRLRTIDTPTDPGSDMFTAGMSIPIPSGSVKAKKAQQQTALAQQAAAQADIDAFTVSLGGELTQSRLAWERSLRRAETYDQSLLPNARAARDSTLADYRVAKVDSTTLFQAEIQLLELERAWIQAVADAHLYAAKVHGLIGSRPESP